MKLVMRKSEHLDDWYVIEHAEHDGREWLENVGANCMALRRSARISDADVEGSAAEMLEIASAIEERGQVSFKRCAVMADGETALFYSPRNSTRDGECSLAEADELAKDIRRQLINGAE